MKSEFMEVAEEIAKIESQDTPRNFGPKPVPASLYNQEANVKRIARLLRLADQKGFGEEARQLLEISE